MGISIDIYMVLKAFDLSLCELSITIEGYEDTAQLIPLMLITCWYLYSRILIGVVIDSNDYFHASLRNLTCACKTSLSDADRLRERNIILLLLNGISKTCIAL
jgi:hypothetical protein